MIKFLRCRRIVQPHQLFLLLVFFIIAPSSVSASVFGENPSETSCVEAPALPIDGSRIISVSDSQSLRDAINNLQTGDTIIIEDGQYAISSLININRSNTTVRGREGCSSVVLSGPGMDNNSLNHIFFSGSDDLTIAHLTIRDVYNHPIALNPGIDRPHIYNVQLLNAGEQFIKGSSDMGEGGIIEYSVFDYPDGPPKTDHGAGLGYTNGMSIHGAENWIIRNNIFRNLHTPDHANYLWNPAVLIWNRSSGTIVENNIFINVDRAIALGLSNRTDFDHFGGEIRNNIVYLEPGLMSSERTSNSDAAIIVYDSPDTKVYHNTVITNGNIVKSIEGRFEIGNAEFRNNLADAPIGFRSGASASLSGNIEDVSLSYFRDISTFDFRLSLSALDAIDAVPPLPSVQFDYHGDERPHGPLSDIGADEFVEESSSETELRSDVDRNGVTTVVDAALTQRKALGLDMNNTPWIDSPETGDADCSQDISIIDAVLIQRRSLNLDMSSSPYCGL